MVKSAASLTVNGPVYILLLYQRPVSADVWFGATSQTIGLERSSLVSSAMDKLLTVPGQPNSYKRNLTDPLPSHHLSVLCSLCSLGKSRDPGIKSIIHMWSLLTPQWSSLVGSVSKWSWISAPLISNYGEINLSELYFLFCELELMAVPQVM